MSTISPNPAQLDFRGPLQIARWRPLVQWLLALPHLFIAYALSILRAVLMLVSFFAVVFTGRIPRQMFDAIAMTFRYEWRAASYALFLHGDYPPFEFQPAAEDDGAEPHTLVSIAYPPVLSRWQPLVKWLFAFPHYLMLAVWGTGALIAVLIGLFVVLITGQYPQRLRDFLVGVYRYNLRVQAYAGLLTDQYPPFRLHAR